MQSGKTFWLGIGGIIIGMLALGTESMPWLGFDRGAQSSWFRMLAGLSVLTLLSAILLTAVGLARVVEEQPTRVQPIVDGFLLGRAYSNAGHTSGHLDSTEGDPVQALMDAA